MILVDPPNAAGHGRLWSHLASDTSYDELHVFAARMGVPTRGFDRDHYDVPAEWYDDVVAAGAVPVSSRELIVRLQRAGLRRRKSESLRPRRPGRPLLRAPLLVPGSVVAALPGAEGVALLSGWGLDVQPRATLTEAWLDETVAAIWCPQGATIPGPGGPDGGLDWRRLAHARPTTLVGSAHVTPWHQALAARLGVSTVLGPGPGLRALLFDGVVDPVDGATGRPGTAEGTLVGGDPTLLAAAGGPTHPAADSIAVLVGTEAPASVLGAALARLRGSGWFDRVRAVVCGRLGDDPAAVRDAVADHLGPLGVPWIHGAATVALPWGVRARLVAGGRQGRLSVDAHPGRRARA